ncbi:hypothetical protein DNTS_016651 [Danionella cerebrum]|uniref:Uncharacterized protein n=1 Tax=Danionella cerebrum TaxID=2873325 RepID=A0A553Q0B5_9TELE|nr:hypothetical protein DNTS_016651 [Danionella translucida]
MSSINRSPHLLSGSNSSGIQENHLQRDRDQQYSPCSMSISSGSFSSGDAAPLSAGSGQKSDALQSIIERYGRELRETLSPAGTTNIFVYGLNAVKLNPE